MGWFSKSNTPENKTPSEPKNLREQQKRVFVTTFSMLAKLAKADGRISKPEATAVNRLIEQDLGLDLEKKAYAKTIFDDARNSEKTFEDFAHEFIEINSDNRKIIEWFFDLMLSVAYADGNFSAQEKSIIDSARNIFGIDQATFDKMKNKYSGSVGSFYSALGCQEGDSTEVVTERYKKLAAEYDPERLAQAGVPPEFLSLAKEKLAKIKEAYAAIISGQ